MKLAIQLKLLKLNMALWYIEVQMVVLLIRCWILSRSSRKCTVTGIDSHELQGLDVVQCVALVETNHGIVNLIMNEYACHCKGHTIQLMTDLPKLVVTEIYH